MSRRERRAEKQAPAAAAKPPNPSATAATPEYADDIERVRKPPKRRRAVSVTHKRTPNDDELRWARQLVMGLGDAFHAALTAAINEGRNRPGSITAWHVLIAWALLVTENNHQAEYTDAAAQLHALNAAQKRLIDLPNIDAKVLYNRFHYKGDLVMTAMDEGFTFVDEDGATVSVDADWFLNRLCELSIAQDAPRSRTVGIDGTAWETCARFRPVTGTWSSSKNIDYDGDAQYQDDVEANEHAKEVAKTRASNERKQTWAVGPDGRAVHTLDIDARGGYRTGTNGRKGGTYVGYELHLMTQAPDHVYSGQPTALTFKGNVPAFILGASLRPAGSHRGNAVVPWLQQRCDAIGRVIWDRGYSLLGAEQIHVPLREGNIEAIFDLSKQQRAKIIDDGVTLCIDGTHFDRDLPKEYWDLPMPPMNASEKVRKQHAAKFDERARWAWVRHNPNQDGSMRFKCPFCAGKLAADGINRSRASENALQVELPAERTKCCDGTITIGASKLTLFQASGIPYGTTAWQTAYGPRNLTETSNSYLRGTYTNLDRVFTRLFGLAKRTFVLAFTLAGLNRYLHRQWREQRAAQAKWDAKPAAEKIKKKRKPRNTDNLQAIVDKAHSRKQNHEAPEPPPRR